MRLLNILMLSIGFFVSGLLNAQNSNEFVEVIVEDSISLEPQEFIFSIYITPDYGDAAVDTVTTVDL